MNLESAFSIIGLVAALVVAIISFVKFLKNK